jgi:hypothetical protein
MTRREAITHIIKRLRIVVFILYLSSRYGCG